MSRDRPATFRLLAISGAPGLDDTIGPLLYWVHQHGVDVRRWYEVDFQGTPIGEREQVIDRLRVAVGHRAISTLFGQSAAARTRGVHLRWWLRSFSPHAVLLDDDRRRIPSGLGRRVVLIVRTNDPATAPPEIQHRADFWLAPSLGLDAKARPPNVIGSPTLLRFSDSAAGSVAVAKIRRLTNIPDDAPVIASWQVGEGVGDLHFFLHVAERIARRRPELRAVWLSETPNSREAATFRDLAAQRGLREAFDVLGGTIRDLSVGADLVVLRDDENGRQGSPWPVETPTLVDASPTGAASRAQHLLGLTRTDRFIETRHAHDASVWARQFIDRLGFG